MDQKIKLLIWVGEVMHDGEKVQGRHAVNQCVSNCYYQKLDTTATLPPIANCPVSVNKQ